MDEKFEKKEKGFLSLCDTLGGRGGENIESIALELYAFARTQPDYLQLINSWTEEFNLDENEIIHSPWAEFLKNMFKDNFKDMIVLSSKAKEFCQFENGPISYIDALNDDIRYFNEVLSMLNNGNFEKAKELIQNSKFMTLPRKKKTDDEVLVDMCKSLRDSTKSLIKTCSLLF